MVRPVVGVMGPGEDASPEDLRIAFALGEEIARRNWVLLTGGRDAGVMNAASRGAYGIGGVVVGILPGSNRNGVSPYVTLPIVTGTGEARNVINVLTSDLIIGVGMNPGTASEIALAIKAQKPIFLLNCPEEGKEFFLRLSKGSILFPSTLEETLDGVEQVLKQLGLTNS